MKNSMKNSMMMMKNSERFLRRNAPLACSGERPRGAAGWAARALKGGRRCPGSPRGASFLREQTMKKRGTLFRVGELSNRIEESFEIGFRDEGGLDALNLSFTCQFLLLFMTCIACRLPSICLRRIHRDSNRLGQT